MRGWASWSPRARFFSACAIGGLLAAAVCTWVVLAGQGDLLGREALGDFYDAQARSLLHGRWNISADVLQYERFKIGDEYFMYQGPWPAILRMPVVAFTDEFDGRLSRLSMLIAFIVLLVFAARLSWSVRTMARGDGPPSRTTLVASIGFVFVVGCGSTALFLAGRAWIYHEAILWGIAWSVASFSFLVGYLTTGRGRTLVFASFTAMLALLSRPTTGAGPLIALGVVLLIQLAQRVRRTAHSSDRGGLESSPRSWRDRWFGTPSAVLDHRLWPVAAAIAVPVCIYVYVNYTKFGSLFDVPIRAQDLLLQRPERRRALTVSESLFSVRYGPTNLLQYLRPDAIGLDRLFPWVTFSGPPDNIGSVPFDNVEPSASIPASSTLLAVLAAIGAVMTVRAPLTPDGRANLRTLRVPLLGALLATAGVIFIGVQFHRYQGDFVPFLVVAGAAGLFSLPALLQGRRRIARGFAQAAVVVLGVWTCWATLSLTVLYQRVYSSFQPTSVRAAFVGFQLDVNEALGLEPPSDVQRGPSLPVVEGREFRRTTAPLGRFFVLDECAGVFVSSRRGWEPVEESAPGTHRWRVRFGAPAPGTREPLWSTAHDGPAPQQVLWVRWTDRRHAQLELDSTDPAATVIAGDRPLRIERDRSYTFDVRLDAARHAVEVRHGDRVLLEASSPAFDRARPAVLGRQADPNRGALVFRGTIEQLETTPLCDRLVAQAGS